MKIAAIVPALNEERNVGSVLKILLSSKEFDEVILVDGGSIDRTVEIGEKLGVRVVSLAKKEKGGKGKAMKQGIESTNAEVIVFFDADLVGLKVEHVSQLIQPILEGRADMVVGIRDRYGGLPAIIAKIDPLLAIGGERAMRRSLFKALPERLIQGFAVETALNYYCLKKKLKVVYPKLKGLTVMIKEKKWGFVKGFKSRLETIWQLLKVRFLLICLGKQFLKTA
jgi:glycosyltransferase involved in cell wall biosynthesis